MNIEKKPRPIPPPGQRFVGSDGMVDKAWYDWLKDWDTAGRKIIDAVNDYETRITALEP